MPSFIPPSTRALASHARHWLVVACVAGTACQDSHSAPTGLTAARGAIAAAKGTGGGGSTSISVTSTSPATAAQDTTLDVTINGSGFVKGAMATWSLNGDTTLVHVKATKLVSSTQLIATVSVPAAAPVASYDVQVTLSDGHKGVGAELFVVTLADPTVTWMLPLADAGLALKSDRKLADSTGTYSVYADGLCGVTTWVEMAANDPFPGFAHLSTNGNGRSSCSRSLTLVYPDGVSEAQTGATQRGLEDFTRLIAPGETQKRTLAILPASARSRCGRVLFGQGSQGAGVGSDSVLVTRVDARTWHIRSNADQNLALCENTSELFHMPVDFLIVADDPSRFP